MPPRSERTKREQRLDRDRQTSRRARMKEAGQPATHTTRSAMAEALSFAIAKWRRGKLLNPEILAFLTEWESTAEAILVQRKGHDPAASKKAVFGQIKRRKEHQWPGHVPTMHHLAERDDI